MDVLVIYQFCTFGGVERAVLNRAKALRKHGLDVKMSVGYLHDYGALHAFQEYIRTNDLAGRLSAFLVDESTWASLDRYDFVLAIDTPQAFQHIQHAGNFYIECHTAYTENRQYLKALPQYVRGILVPSASFRDQVRGEFPNLPTTWVLPNPVAEEFLENPPSTGPLFFSRRPLTYFARLDELKNIQETLRIFTSFASRDDLMFFIIGKGPDPRLLLQDLERKGLLARTLVRDGIPFDQAPALIDIVRRQRGLFISPSRGESFGLSAAEFISGGVPVMLSDIPAHRELVEDDDRFFYRLGDVRTAGKKISALLQDWEAMSLRTLEFARKFKEDPFVRAWQEFTSKQKM